jgi:hypothetical protein
MVKDVAVDLHEYCPIILKTYRTALGKQVLDPKLNTSPYQIMTGVVRNNIKL